MGRAVVIIESIAAKSFSSSKSIATVVKIGAY